MVKLSIKKLLFPILVSVVEISTDPGIRLTLSIAIVSAVKAICLKRKLLKV